jgi:hypothetical protein
VAVHDAWSSMSYYRTYWRREQELHPRASAIAGKAFDPQQAKASTSHVLCSATAGNASSPLTARSFVDVRLDWPSSTHWERGWCAASSAQLPIKLAVVFSGPNRAGSP